MRCLIFFILCSSFSFNYAQSANNDSIYEKVDVLAEYIGGQSKLYMFLGQNIQYPPDCIDNEIQGKVFVKFVIKKDGSLDNFIVVNSIHPLLDQEALRVIKSMPKWEPAKVNGQKVNSYFTLPINFQLN